jgi:hypothetical protein
MAVANPVQQALARRFPDPRLQLPLEFGRAARQHVGHGAADYYRNRSVVEAGARRGHLPAPSGEETRYLAVLVTTSRIWSHVLRLACESNVGVVRRLHHVAAPVDRSRVIAHSCELSRLRGRAPVKPHTPRSGRRGRGRGSRAGLPVRLLAGGRRPSLTRRRRCGGTGNQDDVHQDSA